MSHETERVDGTRRRLLKGIAGGVAATGVVAAGASPAVAQSQSADLAGWFENTGNADGVADRTGQDAVTVDVGTDGNGAGFGFGPAAVRVDPGTTVTWEWTGKGGRHNVVTDDGSFESDLQEEGTFEHRFENAGVTKYYCTPHEAVGMKGAVIVGDVDVTLGSGGATTTESGASGEDSEELGGEASVDPNYGDWFEDVSNFDGTVDATGRDEVRVEVGASGNGGNLAFEPAAVHVDPGTTVVWEWTGEGGQHNVACEDPEFESPLQSEAGATYALKFDGSGVAEYVCAPHEAAGMKGAVVVGDPAASTTTTVNYLETGLWGLVGAIVAAPFVASEILSRRHRGDESDRRPPEAAK